MSVMSAIEDVNAAELLQGLEESDVEDAMMLGNLIRQKQSEFNYYKDKSKDEKQLQNDISYDMETKRMGMTAIIRATKELRGKLPKLKSALASLNHWFAEDIKRLIENEKEHQRVLFKKAMELFQSATTKNHSLKRKVQDIKEVKYEKLDGLQEVIRERDSLRHEIQRLEKHLNSQNQAVESTLAILEKNRAAKSQVLEQRYKMELNARNQELKWLQDAMERYNAKGGQAKNIDELDEVNVDGQGIKRIPKGFGQLKNAKFLSMEKNEIADTRNLKELAHLQGLNLNKNMITDLDLTELFRLKTLSIAGNNVHNLKGLSENLAFIDASMNHLTDLSGLTTAAGLQVAIFRNAGLLDVSGLRSTLKLLYLDLSENKLADDALDHIRAARLLQYLDVSENLIYNIPDLRNTMINGLDMSSNMLTTLRFQTRLFNLRYVNVSGNEIMEIRPLCMIPLLKELNISNNKIKDMLNIYSLSLAQTLQILDISGNPVTVEPDFYQTVGTLMKSLKILNRQHMAEDPQKYFYGTPIQLAKICRKAFDHLIYHAQEESLQINSTQVDNMIAVFQEAALSALKTETVIVDYMGHYTLPYLVYLTGKSSSMIDNAKKMMSQEKRMTWLAQAIQNCLEEEEYVLSPTWDGILFEYLRQLNSYIDEYYVIHAQSLWRSIRARRLYRKQRKSIIIIQRAYRNHLACRTDKNTRRRLKFERITNAAEKIQDCFMKFSLRKKAKLELERLRRDRDEKRRLAEMQLKDADLMDKASDESEIDDWLQNEDPDLFEKEMQEYLAMPKFNPARRKTIFKFKKVQLDNDEDGLDKQQEMDAVPQGFTLQAHVDLYQTTAIARKRHNLMKRMKEEFDAIQQVPNKTEALVIEKALHMKLSTGTQALRVEQIDTPPDVSVTQEDLGDVTGLYYHGSKQPTREGKRRVSQTPGLRAREIATAVSTSIKKAVKKEIPVVLEPQTVQSEIPTVQLVVEEAAEPKELDMIKSVSQSSSESSSEESLSSLDKSVSDKPISPMDHGMSPTEKSLSATSSHSEKLLSAGSDKPVSAGSEKPLSASSENASSADSEASRLSMISFHKQRLSTVLDSFRANHGRIGGIRQLALEVEEIRSPIVDIKNTPDELRSAPWTARSDSLSSKDSLKHLETPTIEVPVMKIPEIAVPIPEEVPVEQLQQDIVQVVEEPVKTPVRSPVAGKKMKRADLHINTGMQMKTLEAAPQSPFKTRIKSPVPFRNVSNIKDKHEPKTPTILEHESESDLSDAERVGSPSSVRSDRSLASPMREHPTTRDHSFGSRLKPDHSFHSPLRDHAYTLSRDHSSPSPLKENPVTIKDHSFSTRHKPEHSFSSHLKTEVSFSDNISAGSLIVEEEPIKVESVTSTPDATSPKQETSLEVSPVPVEDVEESLEIKQEERVKRVSIIAPMDTKLQEGVKIDDKNLLLPPLPQHELRKEHTSASSVFSDDSRISSVQSPVTEPVKSETPSIALAEGIARDFADKVSKKLQTIQKEQEDGWSMYSEETRRLMLKSSARLQQYSNVAKLKEALRDPIKRLEYYKARSAKRQTPLKEIKKRETVVYEWDNRPGETVSKLFPQFQKQKTTVTNVAINFTGPGTTSKPMTQPGETIMRKDRPVTVLLSEQMLQSLQKPKTATVHKWSPQSKPSSGPYPSMLKAIPSVPHPVPLGTFDLTKQALLPAITRPSTNL
ncbi:hypothetical protein EDD86DRAFT_204958 [Gorgonomyces haynaldii]|nr:hypothetical protein EDD86DRAFT_204958 [Gorgonomyces haynaldii]